MPSHKAVTVVLLSNFCEFLGSQSTQFGEPEGLVTLIQSLNFEESLEFATKKSGQAKPKNCQKGYPCGASCQPKNRKCRNPLQGQAATYQEWLKSAAQATDPPLPTPAPKSKSSDDKSNNKPKSSIDLDSLPQGKQTEFAQEWVHSWDNAPEDLKAVLKVIDEPGRKQYAGKATSHYGNDQIHMEEKPGGKSGFGEAVWRHEYGHHLDDNITKFLGNQRVNEILKGFGIENKEALYGIRDSDPDKFDSARAALNNAANRSSTAFLTDIEREILPDRFSVNPKGRRYISASDEGTKAFDADEKVLIDLKKKDEAEQLQAFRQYYNAYANRGLIASMAMDGTDDSAVQTEIGAAIMRLRWQDDMDAKANAAAVAKLSKGGGKAVNQNTQKFKKELEAQRDTVYEQAYNDFLASDSLQARLLQNVPIPRDPDTGRPKYRDIANLLAHPNNVEALIRSAERGLKSMGLVDDLVGSITTNKVGNGHDDAYYARDPDMRGTEAFANLISIYGTGHPASVDLLEYLAPKSYQFMRRTLQRVVDSAAPKS